MSIIEEDEMPDRNSVHQSPRLWSNLIVLTSGMLGGSIGLAIAQQGDLILNIDSSMMGVVVGAVIGSVIPHVQRPMTAIPLVAAALGVLVPVLGFVGIQRVAPEVLLGLTGVAVVSSSIVATSRNMLKKYS
jgi:hypothetical protein